jgi:hypothetical protein
MGDNSLACAAQTGPRPLVCRGIVKRTSQEVTMKVAGKRVRAKARPKVALYEQTQASWGPSPSPGADAFTEWALIKGKFEDVTPVGSRMKMPASEVWHMMRKVRPHESSGKCDSCGFRFRLSYLVFGKPKSEPCYKAPQLFCGECAKDLSVVRSERR